MVQCGSESLRRITIQTTPASNIAIYCPVIPLILIYKVIIPNFPLYSVRELAIVTVSRRPENVTMLKRSSSLTVKTRCSSLASLSCLLSLIEVVSLAVVVIRGIVNIKILSALVTQLAVLLCCGRKSDATLDEIF